MHPHLSFNLLKEEIEAIHAAGAKAPIYITAGWSKKDADEALDQMQQDASQSAITLVMYLMSEAPVHKCEYDESLVDAEGKNDSKMCRECVKATKKAVKEENIVHNGSGFGALEAMRMAIDGDGTPPASMLFPESRLGKEESIWLSLLRDGKYPDIPPSERPSSYMVSGKWISRMREAASSAPSWLSCLHYGVAAYEYNRTDLILRHSIDRVTDDMQKDIALSQFKKSVELAPNVVAYRNLARLLPDEAESYYDTALALPEAMDDFALVSEYLGYLVKSERYEKAWGIFESLPEEYSKIDRIRISAAVAAIKLGYFDYLDVFFAEEHCDVREGDCSLTDVWFEYCALKMAKERGIENPDSHTIDTLIDEAWDLYPPNKEIDFRMSADKKDRYRVSD